MNRLEIHSRRPFISRVTHSVTLILTLCGLHGAAVLAQTPNRTRETERFVEQKVRAGEDVDLDDKPVRKIGAKFLGDLIESYRPPANKPYRGISIEHAEITDDLNLIAISVPYRLALENCTFSGAVNFFESNFQKGLSLRGSIFRGSAAFYEISVDGDLRVNKAQFKSKSEINFENIKVTGSAFFYCTKFDGLFNLSNSNLEKLECATEKEDPTYGHTEFRSSASFYNLRVGRDASFTRASFDGPVKFESIDVEKNFDLTDVHFNDPSEIIGFASMRVGGNAIFNKTTFQGGFDMSKAAVNGNLEFTKTQAMSDKLTKNFSGMKVDTVIFDEAALASPYSLQGADYRLLNPRTEEHQKTLDLIKGSTYSRNSYTNLEAYYRRMGLEHAADMIYLAGKAAERKSLGFSLSYLWSCYLYVTVGYGKFPGLALLWSLGFIALGAGIFRKEQYIELHP